MMNQHLTTTKASHTFFFCGCLILLIYQNPFLRQLQQAMEINSSSYSSSIFFRIEYKSRKAKENRIAPLEIRVSSAIVSGFATTLTTIPLEVVKTRLQAQMNLSKKGSLHSCAHNVHFKGTLDALVKIGRYEGISSLYRGLNATLMMTIPSCAMYVLCQKKSFAILL